MQNPTTLKDSLAQTRYRAEANSGIVNNAND